jgi:hypothetical protein
MPAVISLYDFTGEALKPWAEAGFECYAFDIQHPLKGRVEAGICYSHADLHNPKTLEALLDEFKGKDIAFCMGFPVCTDLAVSGAAWFAKKSQADPQFQIKAANYAMWCANLFDELNAPYFVENPISCLSTLWRKPDYSFHPYEFGGYIPQNEAEHPTWPEYIAPRDGYKKKTCLWTGGGFVMPDLKPVDFEAYHGNGYSTAMMKLGGKSQRTKNIRSATPRGFARAVQEANK